MAKRPGARAQLRSKRLDAEFYMVTVGEPDPDCPCCVSAGLVPRPASAQREDTGRGQRSLRGV